MKSSAPLRHVAVIPDGNRRWAKEHGLSAIDGHKYVAEKVFPKLIKRAIDHQIAYLTFWIFSRENWYRAQEEVDGLMALFKNIGMNYLLKEAAAVNAKVQILGNRSDLDSDLVKTFSQAEEKTKNNTAITVNLAISYSGRDEIVRAIQRVILSHPEIRPEEITAELISGSLDTAGMPDPDLIIRTSGEQRLSGLFPWQSVYSELYFTPTRMPDFTIDEFDAAIEDYSARQRRYGQ